MAANSPNVKDTIAAMKQVWQGREGKEKDVLRKYKGSNAALTGGGGYTLLWKE